MRYVGIDLAWGERSPTGVAVLDADGALLRVGAARSDDDVVALVGDAAPDCVAGIDAPLVVVNPTGSRPAEQALGRDFRRFQAGCHPSNTGKPEFAHGTRGARIADRLGLPIDPFGTGPRALEVYPHAATVALFDLPRILRYKNKPGRDLALLRAELLRLMLLIAEVVDVASCPAWRDLLDRATGATTKAELRRVEDPVDAVLCAHVARLAHLDPDAVVHYGEVATGVITTPGLPASRSL
ncbi:hypothetical protein GCM10022215_13540 [Nocardioides fonticola]|uniref:DUF429 domain-containing protein n=1 Tax=Nocardioides fonticola TaxID=450363 RepID=A0ABP7XGH7_9ACTN